MGKTDKELTVEAVNTFVGMGYLNSYDLNQRAEKLTDLIKSVHETIHALPRRDVN